MDPTLDSELRNDFLVEAGELVQRLGEQLIGLKTSPRDADLLNAVFRAFHTVKGGAGFLGLNPMVELCHRAEDLLNEARNGAIVLNAGFMDALLESLDLLNDMMRAADGGLPIEAAPRSLLDRLLIPGRAVTAPPVALAPPAAAPVSAAPAVRAYDPIEDEFEAMLDAARNEREPASAPSGTISVDSTFVLRTWADRDGFSFSLLSDFWPHGGVAKLYGVFDEDKGVATRGTFIIDKAGVIRWNVVNPIPQARDIAEYTKVLADLS